MDKDEWIATEKVHGANFGIYSTDFGRTVRYAKRSGIMSPNEHFFGYHVPPGLAAVRERDKTACVGAVAARHESAAYDHYQWRVIWWEVQPS